MIDPANASSDPPQPGIAEDVAQRPAGIGHLLQQAPIRRKPYVVAYPNGRNGRML